ncbi:glycosyltransferase family 1 protein [Peribacillus psychrosaccharolyticus]|uniref:glycosyltransferase family 1 protein n=1 Tax=Peribacillus psychrosaccharolyticus TaxID=1407 RepID=UPI003D2D756E
MEPIRILQVVTIMNRGGLETMLMNYYRQIDRSKIQFDFMVHRAVPGHYDEEIIKLGGRIFNMPPIKPGNYRKYFRLLDQFFTTKREYKVVHSHINENSSFVLRAAKKAGVPGRIAHSHLSNLGLDIKLPFRLYAKSTMRDYPSDYFACSKNAGKWLFGGEIAANELTVLNNAVHAKKFTFNQTSRLVTRKNLGITNELVIGHIGRFEKQKNQKFLIDIFYELQKTQPKSLLLLVGEGQLKRSIEKKVKSLGLTKKVRFLGVREDIPNLLHAMDLFLFPSLFEGLPVVLVEAQAAGVQCLVSNSITKESDITGSLGFMSLKESPEKWTQKILSMSYKHSENIDLMTKKGYDTTANAKWLADFYTQYHPENQTLAGGF